MGAFAPGIHRPALFLQQWAPVVLPPPWGTTEKGTRGATGARQEAVCSQCLHPEKGGSAT